jgi:ubiquinone/menaquinone biosynthesis C-methylase UbiE
MTTAGDFAAVARRALWPVGERLVRRVGVGRDEDVLDVACGTGNAAIRAAQAGGRVVEWVEGDAEALPFPDASFDVVLSTFGAMFAPRHRVAAAELARVLRPGGRLGLCTWTPEDHVRDLFAGTGVYVEFERETVQAEPNTPAGYLVVLGRKAE